MNTRHTRWTFVALLMCCPLATVAQDASNKELPLPPPPAPNPVVQKQIAAIVASKEPRDYYANVGTLVSGFVHANQLDRAGFTLEIAHFLGNARSVEDVAGAHGLLMAVVSDPRDILDAVWPWLDVRDSKFGGGCRYAMEAAGATIALDRGGKPRFTHLIERLRRFPGRPPDAVIEFMYRHHPSAALHTMIEVHLRDSPDRDPIILAEGVVSAHLSASPKFSPQAAAELEKLSRHPSWWVRLYVAAVIDRFKEYQPGIIERLAADPHPLVAQRMSTAKH
jgi:hypothetical protein